MSLPTPGSLAEQLKEEFALAVEDEPALAEAGWRCVQVTSPEDLGPDRVFYMRLRRGEEAREEAMSAGQVVAYFADEEAAVDAWKRWLFELTESEETEDE